MLIMSGCHGWEAAVMNAYRQTDQTASEEKMTKQADSTGQMGQ